MQNNQHIYDTMVIKEVPVPVDLPQMVSVHQRFELPIVNDIEATVRGELEKSSLKNTLPRGGRIAILAGSRGIVHIDRIIRTVVETVKEWGGVPFVLSAMGSHGGYTEDGQRAVLANYGITENVIGCPVECPTDVKEIGTSSIGLPMYCCERALAADGIIVVNRIKQHTIINAATESGLLKMLAIGLGRKPGANQAHRLGPKGLTRLVPEVGAHIINRANVLLGLGIVENAYHETAAIQAVEPACFYDGEVALLKTAKSLAAKILVNDIDVLIIDEMGKNISGTGLDTNVIGRKIGMTNDDPERTRITRICVRDLTKDTHGNANGVGYSDMITKRLFDSIDFKVMHTNMLTAVMLGNGKMPVIGVSDEVMIKTSLYVAWQINPERARIVRIKNTLALGDIQVSKAIAESLDDKTTVTVQSDPFNFKFDGAGNLMSDI